MSRKILQKIEEYGYFNILTFHHYMKSHKKTNSNVKQFIDEATNPNTGF